jgi:Txe/YoeB family toxin of Txe-Axe toxin-antitoxin module
MRELLLTTQALADLKWWMKTNPRVALKIAELLEELPKAPFTGIVIPKKCNPNPINLDNYLLL